MKNGYALCSDAGLAAINKHLGTASPEQLDILRGKLCIGMHWDVEVTDTNEKLRQTVSQAFCSAMPVAYTDIPSDQWKPFASLGTGSSLRGHLVGRCTECTARLI